ncbi:VWA domain-containing protein [Nonomuraea sp. NPDC055795]
MDERLRRWRLVLGGGEADGTGLGLHGDDARMDAALGSLYESGERGGLGASAPRVARWLGDVRTYFPPGVVRVMQQDAIDRLDLTRLLVEPEMLEAVEPDVHLAATLLSLAKVMPDEARESARALVRAVVGDLEKRLTARTRTAVAGALDRVARTRRPRRTSDVDWNRTILANLGHYLPDRNTVVPERLVGHARKRRSLRRDVVLSVDQSGSMAESVVYAGVFGAVLASIPALRTRMVVFDTAVADLSDLLHDPVELLFGTQLGGGTDINRALAYCEGLLERPAESVLVLLSDLFEGGFRDEMLGRVAAMTGAGVRVIVLLALSDEGTPLFDRDNAAALAALGVPAFACTPDAFPELMAAAIEGRQPAAP